MIKKILVILVMFLLLVGCSKTDENENIVNVEEEKGEDKIVEEEIEDGKWYIGVIDAKDEIHIKFEVSDSRITGEYYYDSDEIPIEFTGLIDDKTYSVMGEDESEIMFIIPTKGVIQGTWKAGENIFSLYARKDDIEDTIHELNNEEVIALEGKYLSVDSNIFSESELEIVPLFNDMIYFQLTANNGAHTGDCSFLALSENDAFTSFADNVEFKLTKNPDGYIDVYSSNYSYNCDANVGYSNKYSKNTKIKNFDGIELGLANNENKLNILKKVLGDYYDDVLLFSQYYEPKVSDGYYTKIFSITGLSNTIMIMEKFNEIFIAINGYITTDGKNIVFTNTENIVPKEMEELLDFEYEIKRLTEYSYDFDVSMKSDLLSDFIPEGWEIKDKTTGNLNDDDYEDMVLILDKIDSPRVLLVLIGGEDGYTIEIASDMALLGADEGEVFGDPYDGTEILDNNIIISFYGGSDNRWGYTYTFDYKDKCKLIELLYVSHSTITYEVVEEYYDLMANKVLVINYDSDNNQTKKNFVLITPKTIYLNNFNIYDNMSYLYE